MNANPYSVSVQDVAALLPEASIPDTRAAGQKAVIAAEVEDWIASLSATVSGRIDGWLTLSTDRQAHVKAVAKTIIANAAASYVEAARAPERAGKADTSYAGVLWDRWQTGLTDLAATVTTWLERAPESVHSRPAAVFPSPSITDQHRW